MVRVRSRRFTGQTRLPTNKETIKNDGQTRIDRHEPKHRSLAVHCSASEFNDDRRSSDAISLQRTRIGTTCESDTHLSQPKNSNDWLLSYSYRLFSCRSYLWLLYNIRMNHPSDCQRRAQWPKTEESIRKMKTFVEHSHQPDWSNGECYSVHRHADSSTTCGWNRSDNDRESVLLTTPPMSCTRRTTSFSLRFVSYCTQ